MADYATLADVIAITGNTYTTAEQDRIEELLGLVSALIRNEGRKVGMDIDAMILDDTNYGDVVKMVTVDVTVRAMRQTSTGEPMSQETQSALGYSWSGTYAVPGGGVAMSLMNNEKKILGIRRQKYGVMETWQL